MQAGDAAGGPADVMPLPRAGRLLAAVGSCESDSQEDTGWAFADIKEAAMMIGVFSSAISCLMNITLEF
jgi:hypothetical protein